MHKIYTARKELLETVFALKELYIECSDKCTKELIDKVRVALGNEKALPNYELTLDGDEYVYTKRKVAEVIAREYTSRYDVLILGFTYSVSDIKKHLKESIAIAPKIDGSKYIKLMEMLSNVEVLEENSDVRRILSVKTEGGWSKIAPYRMNAIRDLSKTLDTKVVAKWARYLSLTIGDVIEENIVDVANGGEISLLSLDTIPPRESKSTTEHTLSLDMLPTIAEEAYNAVKLAKDTISDSLEALNFRNDLIKNIFSKLKDLDTAYAEGVITSELYLTQTKQYLNILHNYNTITVNALNGLSAFENNVNELGTWLVDVNEILILLKRYFTPTDSK